MVKKLVASTMLMPALALGLYAAPVLASVDVNGNTVTITNNNTANVTNNVSSEASTGKNDANGGNGAQGGNGGDIYNGGECQSECSEGDVKESGTGNGGHGGNGGVGGDIVTGDATAKAKVRNLVNLNRTSLNLFCGCENLDEVKDNTITVSNTNNATVNNDEVEAEAKTGKNDANGGNAGMGGNGGEIDNNGGDEVENVSTGHGGNGGHGALGGIVLTGSAYAKTKVFNLVNKNVTRLR